MLLVMMMILNLPGWMMMTRTRPMVAARREVTVKKTIVLIIGILLSTDHVFLSLWFGENTS